MEHRNRQRAIFYLIAATIGIFLLAVGLPNIQFQPGLPIPGAVLETDLPENAKSMTSEQPVNNPAGLQIVLLIGVVGILVLLVIYLSRKISGKRALQFLSGIIILISITFLLSGLNTTTTSSELGSAESEPLLNRTLYKIAPIGTPPAKLAWFVIGGLVLIVVSAASGLLYHAIHNPRKENALADEATAAIQAIEEGQDLRDVVIRCYQNMVNYMKDEQGLERKEFLTPREFEELLASRGVPALPTHQITRLFEKVRYGQKVPNDDDKRSAMECLAAIRDSAVNPGRRKL